MVISSYTIISDIYRDLDLQNSDFENDAIEWIGRAIPRFGGNKVVQKIAIKEKVTNHRLKIPNCVSKIRFIEYNNRKLSKGRSQAHYTGNETNVSTIASEEVMRDFYLENLDYLNFSFESGDIVLHVNKLPVDNDGYPLMLDIPEHRDYIFYFILEKMLLRGFKHPDQRLTYSTLEEKNRHIYLPKAKNASKKVNTDDMESLISLFVRHNSNMYEAKDLFINSERSPFDRYEI